MNLKNYTEEELLNELKRRKNIKKTFPNCLPEDVILQKLPDVKKFVVENMQSIADDGCPLKDFEHYSFETLLELFYGPNVWEWYNESYKGE